MYSSCTDVICLIVFTVFFAAFIVVGLWGNYLPMMLEC